MIGFIYMSQRCTNLQSLVKCVDLRASKPDTVHTAKGKLLIG